MSHPVDPRLMEVLQAITPRPETLKEIRERYEEKKRSFIKVETSWISRTLLPGSLSQNRPPNWLETSMRELVNQGLVKRSITRFLDEPLEKDTEVFSLVDLKKK